LRRLPTGFLHIGSARTFIFNWLYARHNGGTMILRIDDTDVERNTRGLARFHLRRAALARSRMGRAVPPVRAPGAASPNGEAISKKAWRTAISRPPKPTAKNRPRRGTWLFNPGMRELPREESDRRAAAGRAVRAALPRAARDERSVLRDAVYGEQSKSTADIEDFALLRSNGMPTYHLASCADDADLRISHIIRGQDHLTNTFKHVLIFEPPAPTPPQFAHLPLLIAPDGTKLSKRRHGPVVSVTTYRDAGFLPASLREFPVPAGLVAQERSRADDAPGTDRRVLVRRRQSQQRGGQFHRRRPLDPKALWLNAEHIRTMPVDDLADRLLPVVQAAGFDVGPRQNAAHHAADSGAHQAAARRAHRGDFFFRGRTAALRQRRADPAERRCRHGAAALEKAREVLADGRIHARRAGSRAARRRADLGIKAGQMFEPIRVAVCGRKNAPPLFGTLEVLGRDVSARASIRPSESCKPYESV
jgi:glutamyl-tRNA synthetase